MKRDHFAIARGLLDLEQNARIVDNVIVLCAVELDAVEVILLEAALDRRARMRVSQARVGPAKRQERPG